MTTPAAPAEGITEEAANAEAAVAAPARWIIRDIARGGLTGAIVGLVACGLGGRLVMRLAALLVPEAIVAPTVAIAYASSTSGATIPEVIGALGA